MSSLDDPALETLLLPFSTDLLNWPPDGAIFLRARAGRPLQQRSWPGLVCEQTFKPDADALKRDGFAVNPPEKKRYPLVLILPPRQRDESRALLARAVELTEPGGQIIAAQHNNEGARSMEADLEQIAGPLTTLTKHKCRACWTGPLDGAANPELARQWLAFDSPQRIDEGRFLSRPGIFAWDRIDTASALLAGHLPAGLSGSAADLGAGFGYLSAELLRRCPRIDTLDVYEAESRALDLARDNLAALQSPATIHYHWHDVTLGLGKSYDVIVTNPPFHTGSREDRPDIGRRFISMAAAALRPHGQLWLVANRHLPYETVLNESFGAVRTIEQRHGFKIVVATKHA